MNLDIHGLGFKEVASRRYVITIAPQDLRDVVEKILKEDSYLSAIAAVDHPAEGRIELNYIFWSVKHRAALVVKINVNRNEPAVPTITDIVPGALGNELEVYDLMGVVFEGNGKLRRGFLAPEDIVNRSVYPLRKDSGV